jgi:hypothetical protein
MGVGRERRRRHIAGAAIRHRSPRLLLLLRIGCIHRGVVAPAVSDMAGRAVIHLGLLLGNVGCVDVALAAAPTVVGGGGGGEGVGGDVDQVGGEAAHRLWRGMLTHHILKLYRYPRLGKKGKGTVPRKECMLL